MSLAPERVVNKSLAAGLVLSVGAGAVRASAGATFDVYNQQVGTATKLGQEFEEYGRTLATDRQFALRFTVLGCDLNDPPDTTITCLVGAADRAQADAHNAQNVAEVSGPLAVGFATVALLSVTAKGVRAVVSHRRQRRNRIALAQQSPDSSDG